MDISQFYYVREVLGVKNVIKPLSLKSLYQLSQPVSHSQDFLFFCEALKTPLKKKLVKNIAKAIKAEEEQVIEILDFQYPKLTSLFQTLLFRFPPQKGVVIFGEELAKKLISFLSLETNSTKAYTNKPLSSLNQSQQDLPIKKTKEKGELKVPYSTKLLIPFNRSAEISVQSCVIHSVGQLTNSDPVQTKKNKQSAWATLHKTFL